MKVIDLVDKNAFVKMVKAGWVEEKPSDVGMVVLSPEFVVKKMYQEQGLPPEVTVDYILEILFPGKDIESEKIKLYCSNFYDKVFQEAEKSH